MNHPFVLGVTIVLFGLGGGVRAQEKPPVPAAVAGVKGVKQDAVEKVKNIQAGATAVAAEAKGVTTEAKGVVTGAKDAAVGAKGITEGTNKIDGVETINGVKAEGHTAVVPVQPVVVGAGTIQAVNGVTGINTAKLQNLEAALLMKHDDAGPHPDGKGRAAAAGLLGAPNGKPAPKALKEDGRNGFQEFEKLQNAGS